MTRPHVTSPLSVWHNVLHFCDQKRELCILCHVGEWENLLGRIQLYMHASSTFLTDLEHFFVDHSKVPYFLEQIRSVMSNNNNKIFSKAFGWFITSHECLLFLLTVMLGVGTKPE